MAGLVLRAAPALFVALLSLGLTSFQAGPSSCDTAPPSHFQLSTPGVHQEEANWCWAAAGQMTMNAIHPASQVTQCDEANKAFHLNVDCCTNPRSLACKFPLGGFPNYTAYNFSAERTDAPGRPTNFLEWGQIQRQIACKKKPIAFAWRFPGGGGHMMVMTGYRKTGGQRFIIAHDPEAPLGPLAKKTFTYEAYRDGTNFDKHWLDFFDITFVGGT